MMQGSPHTAGLVAATALRGFQHGLPQPCLQLTLLVQPVVQWPVHAVNDEVDVLLMPMKPGVPLRLSDELRSSPAPQRPGHELWSFLEVCHELMVRVQESAGWPVGAGAVVDACEPQGTGTGQWQVRICFPSLDPMTLMLALPWLLSRLGDRRPPPAALAKAPATLSDLLGQMERAAPPGTNTRLLLAAAYEKGVPVRILADSVMQYGWCARSRWMDSSFTDAASGISTRLARDKIQSSKLLRRAGFPVPEQTKVASIDEAASEARRMGYPVVIKPSNLDGGRGVEAGLSDESALRKAYERARAHSDSLILEKHVPGRDFRMGVLNGVLTWLTYREPAGVWGDGVSTLSELIDISNRDPRRGTRRWSQMVPITINDEAMELLAEQHRSLDGVVPAGTFVQLRRAANTSSGGKPTDVIRSVHPDNAALAVAVARLFRLDIAGIDFITPDISRSWREVGGAVCEINGQPQFSVTRPDVPGRVISELVRQRGRVPVAVILAPLADGPWHGHISRRLAERAIRPGWALPDGIRSGADVLSSERLHPFDQVQALLLDTSLHALVVVTDGLAWLESGLPVDKVDLVICDGSEDPRVVRLLRPSAVNWWQIPPAKGVGDDGLPDWTDRLVDFIADQAGLDSGCGRM